MMVTQLCSVCHAFDFKGGDYYFDNSKLHFSTVKMVLGGGGKVTVLQMDSLVENDWWIVTLDGDMDSIDGYSFIESEVQPGTYSSVMESFLDSLCLVEPESRMTIIRDGVSCESDSIVGWVFCPINDCTFSDGYWRPCDSYGLSPTRTLPVIHITTQDSVTVSSKDYYIDATFWLDNCGNSEFSDMGDEANQLAIEIKGRGNYTWRMSYKKPYKIKFLHKQSPLGLDNSKHFILRPDFNDSYGYLRNETGFELSRQLGMPYTPRQYPVELILNGEYQGLYFLCEKIRVEGGRVDIMEQRDMDYNPDNATGGWLLETGFDSNVVITQYQNCDSTNSWFGIMSHSPEILSPVQKDYIHYLLFRVDSCIYVVDKNDRSWETLVDINSLARFYVIHEVMDNVEAFSGSMFMYKDYGWDEKLKFGPVWDFDNSFSFFVSCDNFICDYEPAVFSFLWIKEAKRFPRFQKQVKRVWKEFMDNSTLEKLIDHAAWWRSLITEAELQDAKRWRTYASVYTGYYVNYFLNLIGNKVAWLDEQWGSDSGINTVEYNKEVETVRYYNLAGVESAEPFKGVSIKVTTYSDGSRKSEKIVR
ncbi:MAG: CotH kinase family protein [Muribaculaceae bacterium]|nr:CotH kinase family protein [Muribaculaceae bacterium]